MSSKVYYFSNTGSSGFAVKVAKVAKTGSQISQAFITEPAVWQGV
jgi:hypothetical protein